MKNRDGIKFMLIIFVQVDNKTDYNKKGGICLCYLTLLLVAEIM